MGVEDGDAPKRVVETSGAKCVSAGGGGSRWSCNAVRCFAERLKKRGPHCERLTHFCFKPFEYQIMSFIVPSVHESKTREQPRLERAVKSVATRGLLECLIVSPRDHEREVLSRAAAASGWASVVCGDAGTARDIAQRIVVKLAFIDLERAPLDEIESLQELASELSRMGCPLLVVCGTDGDTQQEIWARQLGAWLYLPGMAGVDAMTELCAEARSVVERSNSNHGR
jgi:hypothetical protein